MLLTNDQLQRIYTYRNSLPSDKCSGGQIRQKYTRLELSRVQNEETRRSGYRNEKKKNRLGFSEQRSIIGLISGCKYKNSYVLIRPQRDLLWFQSPFSSFILYIFKIIYKPQVKGSKKRTSIQILLLKTNSNFYFIE